MAVLLVAALVALIPGKAFVQQDAPPAADLPAGVPSIGKGDPKIEHSLYSFFVIDQTQGREKAKEYAERRRLDLEDDRVLCVVEAETSLAGDRGGDPVPALMSHIQVLGGRVETFYQDLVQCQIPATRIPELAAHPLVRYLRPPLKPYPLAVTSEGVALTGANLWSGMEPYRNGSAKVKVAVLDLGFYGYPSLLGTELPSSVTTRSFRADGNIQAATVHGAACAEIIYDMDPDVDLYLVNFSTDVEHHQAVDWLIGQRVEIISYSIGWFNAGDGKGTGPICQDVKKASDNGIFWASSAGNEAEDHWEGTYSDTDSDRWHNFTTGNEILNFYVPAYTSVGAFLNWDDWGTWSGASYSGSSQDYDLELLIWNGSNWVFVDGSYNFQTGTQWPVEAIGYWYATFSTYWGVAIYRWSTTRNCKLELFTIGNSSAIQYNVPAGSLTIPSDSPYALAAGAVDAVADALHSYSSRGPTHDGRTKPDFASPSGVSTASYGTRNFYGTSASAPHLAGGLALMKGMTPYTLDQIKTILEQRAVDKGDAGKDNIYGVGRLNLRKK